jgi:hypothetical protein
MDRCGLSETATSAYKIGSMEISGMGHFELANCTNTLLSEIANTEMRVLDVGITYGLALRSSEPTDWARVNKAILDRWSLSSLERIKAIAWRKKTA